ncbi:MULTISPECIES: RNA polymerase sigma factor [Bacillaceae]|uniref:RNA polymerase sigma factor n=1 Tax=Evansella alkalicola TaxID=745819 RepID=A0ABS6JNM6_9BACI|nr:MULTISPECIES: RNA polymerase sigma factor [Bacillaceae]MBU9720167.1 RNA polymerase sigma factor [Bacillus alkalicola]
MLEDYQIITDWYEKYSDSIQSFIYIMVHDFQQSEDLMQDTFFRAYRKLDTFKGESTEKTWLFSIAHNVTIDFLRKRKTLQLFKGVFRETPSGDTPESVYMLKEENNELFLALNELKDQQKLVITMRKIKGFSIKETSEILGWSETKVKTTLHRALPVLESKMKNRGIFYEKVT